jgi:UDP-N-acetyl-D-galactosamine dehydrogenase
MNLSVIKIGVIGLGYVGLPLAIAFGKIYEVLGFDINQKRIDEIQNGFDRTRECDENFSISSKYLQFSSYVDNLKHCNIYIVTVPTPINSFKAPDLTPLLKASEMLGKVIKRGDIVIYESTVYLGCTEEDCVPVLENYSGLKFNKDFFCGYSPERINPGDKVNTLTKIKKVTSGSNVEIAEIVDNLYKSIIEAGLIKRQVLK